VTNRARRAGAAANPQGPTTNPFDEKVIRGGARKSSEFDCRSDRRWCEAAGHFINDFIIGFPVVRH